VRHQRRRPAEPSAVDGVAGIVGEEISSAKEKEEIAKINRYGK
jgi:hypothetical protein